MKFESSQKSHFFMRRTVINPINRISLITTHLILSFCFRMGFLLQEFPPLL